MLRPGRGSCFTVRQRAIPADSASHTMQKRGLAQQGLRSQFISLRRDLNRRFRNPREEPQIVVPFMTESGCPNTKTLSSASSAKVVVWRTAFATMRHWGGGRRKDSACLCCLRLRRALTVRKVCFGPEGRVRIPAFWPSPFFSTTIRVDGHTDHETSVLRGEGQVKSEH